MDGLSNLYTGNILNKNIDLVQEYICIILDVNLRFGSHDLLFSKIVVKALQSIIAKHKVNKNLSLLYILIYFIHVYGVKCITNSQNGIKFTNVYPLYGSYFNRGSYHRMSQYLTINVVIVCLVNCIIYLCICDL